MSCGTQTMSSSTSASDTVIVNGSGPVGLTYAMALLDRAAQMGLPKPKVQIWDTNATPWRETVIRLPHIIAKNLPEQVQTELWEETVSQPKRLFVPGPCHISWPVENSRVHNPYRHAPSQYTPIVQIKQFQEACMRYLVGRHPDSCRFNHGQCPAEVMRDAAAVMQCYGKTARKANPIAGNFVSQQEPEICTEVPNENGLFVLLNREDVMDGEQSPDYLQFNQCANGFAVFQSHSLANAVQVYIWPEDATNNTGRSSSSPISEADLINNGRAFGLRALFDCVAARQGQENWWWEVSRRCSIQHEDGSPVPREHACSLEWREGLLGWRRAYPKMGEKASSPAFEAWFDAVRYQVSGNLFKMGIVGTRAENFLHKIRLCYARRQPYRYDGVYTEVENVPVVYLGDSAGSTDFKKGLSCGRGLLCASQLAVDTLDAVQHQLQFGQCANLRSAIQHGAELYQRRWRLPEMISEWRMDYDATMKYLQMGRIPMAETLQAGLLQMGLMQMQRGAGLLPHLGSQLVA